MDVCTDIPTDGHFRPPLVLLGRLGAVDLKIKQVINSKIILTENFLDVHILPHFAGHGLLS